MNLNTWLTPAAVVVVIALITIVFKFGSWCGSVNSDRSVFREFTQEVKKDLENIKSNIARLTSSVAGLKSSVAGLESSVAGLKSSVAGLESSVAGLKSSVAVLVSQKPVEKTQSPTRLNDLGKSISKEIQGKEWAKDVAKQNVEQQRGKQPYDVQKFAFEHAYHFNYSQEITERMKQSAWENGVPIEIISRVLSLELRDALLDLLGMGPPEDHPN
ncbi:MAG: hypothetical protein OXD43_00335 [Bacteroidetes bacterium]|nr:hypothetical protein [Bacteroidota bacterium]